MHARNVEKGDVDVDSWLGVDVSALTDLLPTIGRLAERVLIARELLTEICVNEFTLRIPVLPEDDELTVLVGRVVRSQTRKLGKHKAGLPVRMEVLKDLLSCNNIVITVLSNTLPKLLGDMLIPGKPELLVVQAKLDLPLLEGHLGGCEVVHISVGQVVCLDKSSRSAILDDSLTQVEQLGVVEPKCTSIENMVVVLPAVEADQPHLTEGLDLLGGGVNHTMYPRYPTNLPVHDEQVRENLTVEEHQLTARESHGLLLGILVSERHLHDCLDGCLGLMCRVHGECQNPRLQILDVIHHPLFLGVTEDLSNEIDRGLGRGMDLLPKVALNKLPDLLLVGHGGLVDHFLLLKRQPLRNMSHRDVVAVGDLSPQRGITCEDLDLNVFVVESRQFGRVSIVDVVEVNSITTLTGFGVGRGPF